MKAHEETAGRDFFVSYTGSDRPWAEWISHVLEEDDYTVTVQAWDFQAGGNFVLDMDRAARNSERTIAVLSRAYCEAAFTQPEWAEAFRADPGGRDGLLIPVRVEDFEPEGLFGSINYVDLVGLPEAKGREALLGALGARVRGERRKPRARPRFPGAADTQPHFPGALPSSWNLPLRLRNFSGRDDLLASMGSAVSDSRTCVLFGLGGVGKSRVALEFGYRHLAEYDIVWRVRAHDDATARADLAELATALGLPDRGESRAERLEGLRGLLAGRDRWLLIFDDAVDARDLLPLLPAGSSGHILVTSRRGTGWASLGKPLEVGPFREAEAVSYLQDHLGEDNEEDLRAICAMLGNLPLAVEQAAGYMETTGIDPSRYMARLGERDPEPFRQPRPLDYEHTVSTTWQLAMEEIGKNEDADRLLSMLAYLGPDLIPRGLFDGSDAGSPVSPPFSPVALDGLLQELRRFSLITVAGGRISIHPLVQRVVRESHSPEVRVEKAKAVGRLLIAAWPADSGRMPSSWQSCGALAPHVQAFSAVLRDLGQGALAGGLLADVGLYLRRRGDLSTAAGVYEQALAALNDEGGYRLIKALGDYGMTLSYLDRDEEAVGAQKRALELLEGVDLSAEEEGPVYQTAGMSFCEAGHHEAARELMEKGLRRISEASDPDQHQINASMSNLGNVIRLLGDKEKAKELHLRSLKGVEALSGRDHPDVAVGLGALARVDLELEDYAAAKASIRRAIQIFEKSYGPVSFNLGRAYQDLATAQLAAGSLAEAREAFSRAFENYRETVGPDFVPWREGLVVYAAICKELGDPVAAREAIAEAMLMEPDPRGQGSGDEIGAD